MHRGWRQRTQASVEELLGSIGEIIYGPVIYLARERLASVVQYFVNVPAKNHFHPNSEFHPKSVRVWIPPNLEMKDSVSEAETFRLAR